MTVITSKITTLLKELPTIIHKNTQCIQVIQTLTTCGMLRARIIGISQSNTVIEHTKEIAKKYSLNMKREPIIINRNTCDPLICSQMCNTIYSYTYNNDMTIKSIQFEKNISE